MKLLRYAAVASTAGLLDLALFWLFAIVVGWPYLPVGAATFTVATALNYWLGIRFAFTSGVRFEPRTEMGLVFAVSALGLAVNQAALALGAGPLGLELIWAKLGANALSFAWNYAARRHLVFRAREPDASA